MIFRAIYDFFSSLKNAEQLKHACAKVDEIFPTKNWLGRRLEAVQNGGKFIII